MGRAQVPDKKAKPIEVGVGGGGVAGGNKPLVVPINIVCAPEPLQNEIKTVCLHYVCILYSIRNVYFFANFCYTLNRS